VNVCLACVRRASRGRCVSGAAHAQCSSSIRSPLAVSSMRGAENQRFV